jgi:diaminohydroxyphosphoribosylaminopyrimidine deaminase/5-amino-6-(5-phosphoribosylamino)uracil reductase
MPLKEDIKFMKLAKNLAIRGRGRTNPNPVVGCVIAKNSKVVAMGYHKKAGQPHAEMEAIREANGKRINLKGAVMYVSMEPCCHFGRTPPCVSSIINYGIKRVVIGMRDPNPINNGRGIRALKKAGICVDVGILEEEIKNINLPFIKYITKGLPYVTIKAASSLDGKIATKTGSSKWITGEGSRAFANRLRGYVDAVLVGTNTVIKDNPSLTRRSNPVTRVPWRIGTSPQDGWGSRSAVLKHPIKIILDRKLKIPLDSKIFSEGPLSRSIIATTEKAPPAGVKRFAAVHNVELLFCKEKSGLIDLKDLLKKLAKREIVHILVEGGGETIASFIKEGLADEVYFFIAPKIIGGRLAPTSVEGDGVKDVKEAISLNDICIKKIQNDILIYGRMTG